MNNYFKVLRPGINSTFQDLGRFGLQHLGIVASGCMDQLIFCTSNKLVGNKISDRGRTTGCRVGGSLGLCLGG